MKVHLTGSSSDPSNDIVYLRHIVNTLHKNKVSVVLNWVEVAYHTANSKVISGSSEWVDIVNHNLDAIARSDAVIVEGTEHGFFQGYQIAIALERRLPVLFLSRERVDAHPISGINSRLLVIRQYKDKIDLEATVEEFISNFATVSNCPKLSEKALLYLRGEALISGRSEKEIIDSFIKDKIW